jgi:hypothetical protein
MQAEPARINGTRQSLAPTGDASNLIFYLISPNKNTSVAPAID